jgi:hypothetical protein
MSTELVSQLETVARRRRSLRLWRRVATCWGAAACVALGLIWLQRQTGWASSLALPALLAAAVVLVLFIFLRRERPTPAERDAVALQLEHRFPDLDGRLITALEQRPGGGGELTYLQQRLLGEVLAHAGRNDWTALLSAGRLRLAQGGHWVALGLFLSALAALRPVSGHSVLTRGFVTGVSVTPGDVSIERGNTLVVLARFSGPLPAAVELVLGQNSAARKPIPMFKSLADPMFGGSVLEVASNFLYHVEYAGHQTRNYQVTVYEYPRLERADADVAFPEYTRLPPKHIENTRRLSAVTGSRVDLALRLNKPVASAQLVPREKTGRAIQLQIETNRPQAALKEWPLEAGGAYELQLLDAEGRTNKVPAQFVFEVLTNRTPEIKLASPRGDLRPSPLEEIAFEGTVWDDFGVPAYGLGYAVAGQEPRFIELGRDVPAKEKRPFKHLLRLEELGVEPDQLVSWFVWADDIGADGQLRRTTGDLFFGEVRPFEEVFREGQGMDGQSQGGGGGGAGQGGQSGRLAELQKQIISATWKLQQRQGAPAQAKPAPERVTPVHDSRNSLPNSIFGAALGSADGGSAVIAGSSALVTPTGPIRPRSVSHVMGQLGQGAEPPGSGPPRATNPAALNRAITNADDVTVVRDSQAQAVEQAEAAMSRQQDPRSVALWSNAIKNMEDALARLKQATNSPASFKEALAAEQAAYQALLRLQEHEYQVARSRNQNQRGSSRNQQMQRQLEQLDLAQSEDRYENQRQAQAPQPPQLHEQLQVMNRLQELARRQQDLNERLKELQTALQEARTEEERAEIRRRLNRLQEEEQQTLADVDELRQRMDRPENQSRMAEQRRQLDQTRENVQRASDAAAQGAAAQALAAGTRAQRQLQDIHDQMRKENSSQFADDLRQMRNQARQLAQRQEEISKQLEADAGNQHKSLADASTREAVPDQLARQKERLTNLVERATQISQQAEEAEPLLSRNLYDAVRKFSQDSAKAVKETQEELLARGRMTRDLYDELKETSQADGAKLLDVTSEMFRLGSMPDAHAAEQRARAGIDTLKRGVEHAAESVLGDDTEALRLAQQELDQLNEQLRREIAQAGTAESQTNAPGGQGTSERRAASSRSQAGQETNSLGRAGAALGTRQDTNDLAQAGQNQPATLGSGQRTGQRAQANGQEQANSDRTGEPGQQSGEQANPGSQGQQASAGAQSGGGQSAERAGAGARNDQAGDRTADASAGEVAAGGVRRGADWAGGAVGGEGGYGGDWKRFFNGGDWRFTGPLTGEDFVPWSDRLREVEEMIELPDLRNTVAAARDRARRIRQDFKRDRKKPDWAVVQLQVMQPLSEVRDRIADELARRDSKEALVPLDRDPVPTRYSDLVRRYYEELGKSK